MNTNGQRRQKIDCAFDDGDIERNSTQARAIRSHSMCQLVRAIYTLRHPPTCSHKLYGINSSSVTTSTTTMTKKFNYPINPTRTLMYMYDVKFSRERFRSVGPTRRGKLTHSGLSALHFGSPIIIYIESFYHILSVRTCRFLSYHVVSPDASIKRDSEMGFEDEVGVRRI